MSLVSGTVDSDVALECHLCCPPPLPRKEVSSLDSSWGLCASRLNWRKGKQKSCGCPCLFPLLRGTEWELGWGDYRARDMLYMCVSRTAMCVRVRWGVTWGHVDFLSFFLKFVCLVAIFEVESKELVMELNKPPWGSEIESSRNTLWSRWSRGDWEWELKGQERKKNDIWIACQVNPSWVGRFCCYWWSTLINHDKYFCNGVFFYEIEWLNVFFWDLYLCLIICYSNISRF